MEQVILYEPSIGSNNLGDYVIVDGVKKAFSDFLNKRFVLEFPTHLPLSNRYRLTILRHNPPNYQFICGSNILTGRLNELRHLKQWDISMLTAWQIKNAIFIGVGAQMYQKCNFYTKNVYKQMFHPDYVHSVRDQYTLDFLKSIGITNVVNTGCPTMWQLKEKHCSEIPTKKAKSVVFTITDYDQCIDRDKFMIKVLKESYEKLFFWPQGVGDYSYFRKIADNEKIKVIPPTLQHYNNFLEENDVDFVGTRLHGGMRALQKKRRTIIIGIDNRAKEIHRDFGVPVINDTEIENLSKMIYKEFETKIKLPKENIKRFLRQFDIEY